MSFFTSAVKSNGGKLLPRIVLSCDRHGGSVLVAPIPSRRPSQAFITRDDIFSIGIQADSSAPLNLGESLGPRPYDTNGP